MAAAGTVDPHHMQNVQLWLRDVLILGTVLLLGYWGGGEGMVKIATAVSEAPAVFPQLLTS